MYNVNGIMDFLSKTHPELKTDQHYLCTELRAISRDGSEKVSALQVWNIASDEKRVREFFERIQDRPYCVYYSVGAFHFIKKKVTKMNSESYLSTHILAVDFDGISEDEYKTHLNKIKKMGLRPISVFSGHGFQMIFLLKEATGEPKILKKLCLRMQGIGMPVDMKACCKAQLMRLPFTYNCKELDPSVKNYYNAVNPSCPKTYIYEDSDKTYDCDDVLNRFPKVDDEEAKLERNVPKQRKSNGSIKQKAEIDRSFAVPEDNGYRHYSDIISEEEYNAFHTPIKAMLTKCCEGYRNISLFYMTHYLESVCGFSEETTKKIIERWGTLINYDAYYDVLDEYERMKKYSSNILNTKYDFEMCQKFGKLPKFVLLHKKNGNINLPNGFFSKFKNLKSKVVKTYFSILYFCNNKNTFSAEEICDKANISRATFFRHMDELKENELIENYGRSKYVLIVPQDDKFKGYTVIPGNMLKKALFSEKDSLTSSELKVYMHILYRMGQNRCFWDSQTTIGKALGMSQGSISEITTKLSEKGYIYKHCFKKKFSLAERALRNSARFENQNYYGFLKMCEENAEKNSSSGYHASKYHCIYYKQIPEELIFYSSDEKMPIAA